MENNNKKFLPLNVFSILDLKCYSAVFWRRNAPIKDKLLVAKFMKFVPQQTGNNILRAFLDDGKLF